MENTPKREKATLERITGKGFDALYRDFEYSFYGVFPQKFRAENHRIVAYCVELRATFRADAEFVLNGMNFNLGRGKDDFLLFNSLQELRDFCFAHDMCIRKSPEAIREAARKANITDRLASECIINVNQ